ncbi:HNH endonuclease signature motif containing protein [Candidatus Pantoea soli]|uniref:HNH endonuclease n=1 Tax=Candidatus Pantoea soli TaxID=3098669 RepID=A0A518XDN7_9GAMM|nr:HNH endonuclease [Pantoea soli]QDY42318.1 HNH endonuclease [Pantoea soli]
MDVNPDVTISYSGDSVLDFQSANEIADLIQKSTPEGYVWHHLDDYGPKINTGTRQLVEQNAHSGIPHSGGVIQYKAATGKSYTPPAKFGEKKSYS